MPEPITLTGLAVAAPKIAKGIGALRAAAPAIARAGIGLAAPAMSVIQRATEFLQTPVGRTAGVASVAAPLLAVPREARAGTEPGSPAARGTAAFQPTFGTSALQRAMQADRPDLPFTALTPAQRMQGQQAPAPSQPAPPAPTPIPEVRAPIMTPAAAPTPAPLPPAPTLPGGGERFVGGGIPTPSPLPPAPTLAGDIHQPDERPLGQFDAMIRSLMEQQGGARFVQTPLAGATAFGPAGAQARMLERMRERELGRILGGIPANI